MTGPNMNLRRDALFVFIVAVVARVSALPFSSIDSADSATRVWLGWQWLDNPYLIVDGIWGPLHFYLIGAVLAVWPDPVAAPVALHLLLGALVPVITYFFVLEALSCRRCALVAAIAFAVYPTAIALSILPKSETPFCFFLALALLFLARSLRLRNDLRQPAYAGIAIGLASMLRYEAWLLLPFLSLLILRRPKQLVVFLSLAMVHPVIWMTGNYLAHGDPLYSITWASRWERIAMGNAGPPSLTSTLKSVWTLLNATRSGLSLPLTILVATGLIAAVYQRRRETVWLIPPLGLFILFVVAAAGGSLAVKWQYTVTYGLLLMPFLGYSVQVVGATDWSSKQFVAAAAGMTALVMVSTIEPLWENVPGRGAILARAAPSFQTISEANQILGLVESGRKAGNDALVTDYYGWLPSFYVALHTKLHPDRICTTNGAPNIPLDIGGYVEFFRENPEGVLITQSQGRLASQLKRLSDEHLELEDIELQIEPIGNVPYSGRGVTGEAIVSVSRYKVLGEREEAYGNRSDGSRCAASCVTDLCRRE